MQIIVREGNVNLKEIQLVSFRNYEQEKFIPSDGIHLISGENGRGKTNLLEAIGVGITARSFRTKSLKDVIRFEKKSSYIKTKVFLEGFNHKLEIQINEGHRLLSKDNNKMKTIDEFKRGMGIVVFQPQDLNMIHSSPSLRRTFLDDALRSILPSYEENLKSYYHLLSQRNFALKKLKAEKSLLDVYDIRMAKLGTSILIERLKAVKKLSKWTEESYTLISNQRDKFSMNYLSTLPLHGNLDQLEESYLALLKESFQKDMQVGRTSIGPHLDDLRFSIDGKEAKSFASQGQVRSIVLSLKIAESTLLKQSLGTNPIVLFDDVFSELDPIRREKLMESFKDMQCFITMAEPIEKIFNQNQLNQVRSIKISENGIEEYIRQ